MLHAISFRIFYYKVKKRPTLSYSFYHQELFLCPLSGLWDINNAVGAIYLLREF
jgi:hypothetical protein